MPTLRTGLVLAGAYATKVRKAMFAQLSGKADAGEIARAIAELNQNLYKILVDLLKIEKGDVIRVTIDYSVINGKIKWDYQSLKIEAFKRMPDEKIKEKVRAALV